jgi:uncharacterized protein (DUF1015 family)
MRLLSSVLATIYPFQPYRYTAAAGDPADLVTQPYDKITPEMQARYLARSPYNLVRIILGERFASDSDRDNVYTRAANYLNSWMTSGVLAKDDASGIYVYFQEFTLPDSSERLTRKGFIALGKIEDYAAGIVHRHEQTLSGPKRDRTELLNHTRAHFGQIFMLYPDPQRTVDGILDAIAEREPDVRITDEYHAVHRLWRVSDPARIAQIQQLMADKKLLIADGHHRYETALAFRNAHPEIEDAKTVMMTLVNMYSDGLRILATHRVVRGLSSFDLDHVVEELGSRYVIQRLASIEEMRKLMNEIVPDRVRIGLVARNSPTMFVLERDRGRGELDVRILHEELLGGTLGISEEAVREEENLCYVRGIESAVQELRHGDAQAAFLLQPTPIEQVGEVSFSGGVMPQKSTDFYPKLLSGLTIYRLER